MSSKAVFDLAGQRDKFLAFVRKRVSDRGLAEELLQSAYASALTKGDTLRNEESATAWFYRILRNTIIDYYRHHAVEGRLIESLSDEIDLSDHPHETVCHCIPPALDKLKPAYTDVLRSVDLADDPTVSLQSFAEKRGISTGNAAVRAFRARKALKKQLLHSCGSCATAGCLECICD